MGTLSKSVLVLVLASAAIASSAAAELEGLEEELPLSVEDASPVDKGSIEVSGALRYQRMRSGNADEGRHEYTFVPRIKSGVTRDFELSFAAPYRFGNAPETSQGDASIEGLYQLRDEDGRLPALAVSAGLERPYGAASGGTEVMLKGLMSKSLGSANAAESGRIHFNVALHHNLHPEATERNNRYFAGIAYSQAMNENSLLAASVSREQERQRGQASNMAELGLRWKASENTVLSTGVGHGLNHDAPRWRFTVGVQRSVGGVFGKL
jgi:hypothetical protein